MNSNKIMMTTPTMTLTTPTINASLTGKPRNGDDLFGFNSLSKNRLYHTTHNNQIRLYADASHAFDDDDEAEHIAQTTVEFWYRVQVEDLEVEEEWQEVVNAVVALLFDQYGDEIEYDVDVDTTEQKVKFIVATDTCAIFLDDGIDDAFNSDSAIFLFEDDEHPVTVASHYDSDMARAAPLYHVRSGRDVHKRMGIIYLAHEWLSDDELTTVVDGFLSVLFAGGKRHYSVYRERHWLFQPMSEQESELYNKHPESVPIDWYYDVGSLRDTVLTQMQYADVYVAMNITSCCSLAYVIYLLKMAGWNKFKDKNSNEAYTLMHADGLERMNGIASRTKADKQNLACLNLENYELFIKNDTTKMMDYLECCYPDLFLLMIEYALNGTFAWKAEQADIDDNYTIKVEKVDAIQEKIWLAAEQLQHEQRLEKEKQQKQNENRNRRGPRQKRTKDAREMLRLEKEKEKKQKKVKKAIKDKAEKKKAEQKKKTQTVKKKHVVQESGIMGVAALLSQNQYNGAKRRDAGEDDMKEEKKEEEPVANCADNAADNDIELFARAQQDDAIELEFEYDESDYESDDGGDPNDWD